MSKIKLKKINISLKFFIIASIIAICVAVIGITYNVFNKVYYKEYKEAIKVDVLEQGRILQEKFLSNAMTIDNPLNLNQDVDAVAAMLSARIIVVNGEYRIIKDTYGERLNSIVVNSQVIQVMSEKVDYYMEELPEGYIRYICPVKGEEGTVGVILIIASLDKADVIAENATRQTIFFGVLVMFACALIAIIIGILSVRSMKIMNRHMEQAKEGGFDEQIPVQGFKEMRALTENYNDTMNKLAVLDSTRQEFVSNVSHELKTPITSMKVLAESLIQNEEADLPMYKEFMSDISEEIERESKIISDLLTLVKMDKKSAEMNIEEVDINALLEIILKRVIPIANSRGIEITYESYREVKADVDEVKLSLALTNIIENAVKYNVDNGWVNVTLNADHKYFYIKVADSGVGIPDDCKEQVFERFYRVDKARSRDTGGTGLGLAITKNVILMHKGTIKLYSESGEGSTFTIKIPIKRVEN
ncbi:MAG: two-component sensor histidine kinase [Lachnospiraceae bacterium]|nr:two-component sensor histidine kinase [Lachnospiraceae bacterium]